MNLEKIYTPTSQASEASSSAVSTDTIANVAAIPAKRGLKGWHHDLLIRTTFGWLNDARVDKLPFNFLNKTVNVYTIDIFFIFR